MTAEVALEEQGRCPTGCGRRVPDGQLMCRPCWSRVPPGLQGEVFRTWRAWRADHSDPERLEAYRAARDAAIEAVP